MEDFWKSVQTIQAERGADYRAFSLFSATHWAELLGAAAVIFLCAVIYYRCKEVTRHQILRAVFVLMLADEFMKQAVLLILYPVLLLAGGFRPQVHHIRWVLAFPCATAMPIFFLNRLLKTNFFFLNDPQGNAITAFFAHCLGERFYLLGFLPVLAAVLLLLYLPWYRAERHQRMLYARNQVAV